MRRARTLPALSVHWLSWVAVAVVLILLVSVSIPDGMAAAAQENAAAVGSTEEDSPALPATDEPAPTAQVPQGDFEVPQDATARAVDPAPVEPLTPPKPAEPVTETEAVDVSAAGLTVVSQTESSTTYESADGATVTHLSTESINAETADGEWVEPNTALSRSDGEWTVEDHPLSPVFSNEADEAAAVTVSREGHDVSFSLVGAGPGDVESPFWWWDDWDTLTYQDVKPGVDLTYDIQPGAVKETLVLNGPPSARARWTWRLDTGELTPRLGEADSLELVDAAGEVVLMVPTPTAWDSSGVEGESSPATVALRVGLTQASDGTWRYILGADPAWLADEDREYPVFIDPTLMSPTSLQAFKSDGSQVSGQGHVGNTREGGTNRYWRTVAGFDYGSIPGQFIYAAQVGVGFAGYDSAVQEGWVQHASGYSYGSTGTHLGYYHLGTGWADTEGWGVAERLAQQLATGGRPGFMIGGYEGSSYSHKQIGADLWVESWGFPTVSGTAPAQNATGVGLTPTLSLSTTNPGGRTQQFAFEVFTDAGMTNAVAGSGWIGSTSWQVPEGMLRPGTSYYWRASVVDDLHGHLGQSTFRQAGAYKLTTNQVPLPAEGTAAPGNPAMETPETVTTLTPTLQVGAVADTDGTGGSMKYQFKIASGSDAKSGAVVTSGWITAAGGMASWTVPAGSLQDGGVYTWTVLTTDGQDENRFNTWVKRIRTDLRLGASGPSPFDTLGPVNVNLANGNATVSFSSPTVQTVGGAMGMSFTYNSQEVPNGNRGLLGEYFDARVNGGAPSTFSFDQKTPALVRTDPAVSFDWAENAPADALPSDNFMARWTGFVTLPAQYAGQSVQFGIRQDDGARLWVNGEKLVDNWVDTSPVKKWGSARTYDGSAMPIRYEYYEKTVTAVAELWIKVGTAQFVVPPDWFTKTVQVLPQGWAASTPVAGASSNWVSALITDSAIVLTDATGKAHTYTKASTGGYTPPSGEYGVVSLDGNGWVVFTDEDGTVYQFGAEGRVASATPPADVAKSAAPLVIRNSDGVATEVVDPVSKSSNVYLRKVTFTYQDGARTVCPQRAGAGYADAPADMLCVISYPDGTETELFYNSNGQLAAIDDPGQELTLFGYNNTQGFLSQIRDAAANDSLPLGGTAQANDPAGIGIAYSGTKATVTKLPSPDGVTLANRPQHHYGYPATGQSTVTVDGISGVSRTVAYDSAWRLVSSTSALGVTSSQQWHPDKDFILSATDAAGLTSTTIYDGTDRPIESYGPAPAACYDAARKPIANPTGVTACGVAPAKTSTAYDGTYQGLRAAFYANKTLTGKPAAYTLGLTPGTGAVDRDWGTAAPDPAVNAEAWSLRLTGLITFPTAGTYQLRTTSDDGARLWLDDVRLIDRWVLQSATDATSTSFTVTAGETRRIRVEYFDETGDASLRLKWMTPSSNGAFVTIPGAQLRPDYGLVTQTTTTDSTSVSGAAAPSITAQIEYADPVLGQPTETTVDPNGLALTTTAGYEAPGATGWLRQTSRTLPAANAASNTAATASITRQYYSDTGQTGSATCGVPAGSRQYGMLKSSTSATPATGAAVVTSYIYDVMGRIAGTKVSGDTAWSCLAYDARGRVTTQTIAGPSGTSTRTITTAYTATATGTTVTVTGPPITGTTNSVVTTKTDFLGRATSYTDAWGAVTTTQYENLTGRVLKVTTTGAGLAATDTEYAYDTDGKVTQLKYAGQVYATPTYDGAGRLTNVDYLGGARLTITRDKRGMTTKQDWSFPAPTAISDTVTRSVAGRIVQEMIAQGGTSYTSKYTYDGAGRLTKATIPGHQLTYAFAATGGCGVNTAAGASGNRTAYTDAYTAPGTSTPVTTSTQYCYDWADRLTSAVLTQGAGTTPLTDGLAATEIAYDTRGNTTLLADMTLKYDSSNQHVKTTYADGTTVTINRDPTGRIASRTTDPAGTAPATVVKYLYAGAGDAAWAIVPATGPTTIMLSLPGGVTVDIPATGTATWSYPSLQGHTLTTGTGVTTTGLRLYDPYGQPLDPTTLEIGTPAAEAADTLNDTGGWHQSAQKLTETIGSTSLVEMGARLYLSALGRFLQVDPVEGGVDNDYVWSTDSIGKNDLSGRAWWDELAKGITDSPIAQSAFFACGFIVGAVAAICGGVQAALYVAQGDWTNAAISVASMAVGSVAGAGLRAAVSSVARASLVPGTVSRAANAATARVRQSDYLYRMRIQINAVANLASKGAELALGRSSGQTVLVATPGRTYYGRGRMVAV